MKIVHIAPNAPYNEGWSYQENLLPKYHYKQGNEVVLIITNTKHENGKIVQISTCDYMQTNGVRLIRLKSDFGYFGISFIARLKGLYDLLQTIRPDYIFFHGLVSFAIFDVIKYKKQINPKCWIVQDNHLDYNIGFKKKGIKSYLIRTYYRTIVRLTLKYINKVYGVTPWRKQYVEDYFNVPKSKTDILIMGSDDDVMDLEQRDLYRQKIRQQFNILDTDFLIISGGKLEKNKKIDVLIKACGKLKNKNVKLILFGSVNSEDAKEFTELLSMYDNVFYVGWLDSVDCYKYFYASELVCFPGQHSVLWEQACASKVPCLFAKWEGMYHVNNGGNADFFSPINEMSLKNKLEELLFTEKYYKMLSVSQSDKTDIYLYSNIAKKSIEDIIS